MNAVLTTPALVALAVLGFASLALALLAASGALPATLRCTDALLAAIRRHPVVSCLLTVPLCGLCVFGSNKSTETAFELEGELSPDGATLRWKLKDGAKYEPQEGDVAQIWMDEKTLLGECPVTDWGFRKNGLFIDRDHTFNITVRKETEE